MRRKARQSDKDVVVAVRLSWLVALWNLLARPVRLVWLELRFGARDLLRFAALSSLTVAAFTLIFQPLNWWPLAFVCLVPWAFAACQTARPWVAHWLSFFSGWAFFLVNLAWLAPVDDKGYVALSFYLALYWTLTVWAIRTGRRLRIPIALSLPVAWVACEFLRGWAMSGFPWLFLAHAFAVVPQFIQISDITGAYGVSFLVLMVNGLLVDALNYRLLPAADRRPARRSLLATSITTVVLLTATLVYGAVQLAPKFIEGPRIAVIQEDFVLRNTYPYSDPVLLVFARYMAMGATADAARPDLVVFPETTWGAYQNIGFLEEKLQAVDDVPASAWAYGRRCHDATAAFARGDYAAVNQIIEVFERSLRGSANNQGIPERRLPRLPEKGAPTTVVIGAQSLDLFPEATYPKQKRFNSALVYDPDGQQRRTRYDKRHLVPFGEFVPFRNTTFLGVSLHWLYRSLNKLSPFSDGGKFEYSLWFGDELTVFDLKTEKGAVRFGTPICYEDVMPYLVRHYVWQGGKRRVDFLVNISNDGWFLHSAELPQHLAISVFRAVENRVGIARAVNTGGSGFIDPCGRVYGMVSSHGKTNGPGIVGASVQNILIDQRTSLYGLYGDWFAGLCVAGASLLWLGAIATRWVFAVYQHMVGPSRAV